MKTIKRILRNASAEYVPLGKNERHMFSMAHSLRLYRSDSIYSFIPKNACSTMRLSLAFENGCIDDEKDISWIHRNNKTFSADLASLITAQYTFTILRCPFARLASVYLDKIVNNLPASKIFISASGHKYDPDKITFSEFALEMKKKVVIQSNFHWIPQCDFLVYKDYDDYFAVEQLDSATKILKEKINFEVRDARSITKHGISHLKRVDDKDYSMTPASEIRGMKTKGFTPDPRTLFNDDIISAVRSCYKDDIALYKSKCDGSKLMFAS